jgi:hypothetical protein
VSFNISHAQGELLAQVRPGVTTPVLAFTASNLRTEITLFIAAIDPAGPANVNIAIYHDDEGTSTFDMTTLIGSEQRTNQTQNTMVFQAQHPGSGILIKPGGQIAVQTDNADDVNFSIYGITETLSERLPGRV